MKQKTLHISFLLVLTILIAFACNKDSGTEKAIADLKVVSSFSLDIEEPSGLCVSWNKEEFFVVSDHNNHIFRINMEGETIAEFEYTGNDLEGICCNIFKKQIWIVDEGLDQITCLSQSGEIVSQYNPDYGSHEQNSGLEGISINPSNDHIWVLNEKSPGLLMEIYENTILTKIKLDFARDYSGIDFDTENNILWIISDEEQSIYKCNLNGEVLETYTHHITQAEGIIAFPEDKIFWVVSDADEKLYKLELI